MYMIPMESEYVQNKLIVQFLFFIEMNFLKEYIFIKLQIRAEILQMGN